MENKQTFVRSIIAVSIVFVVSRLIFFWAGVRFDARPLVEAIHLIDPTLMKQHLIQSLFYLHGQPPLFNLFVGAIYKLCPHTYPLVFHGFYLLTGYLMAIGLFILLRLMTVPRLFSLGIVGYFIVNPAIVLLENWLMYTHFIITLLIWAAVFLFRYQNQLRMKDGLIFFFLLAILALTKSTFHLFWFVLLLGILTLGNRRSWKKVLLAGLVPFVLIFAVYCKNLVLFGHFATSEFWKVYNLSEMVLKHLPSNELIRLAREGKISVFTSKKVFAERLQNNPQVLEAYKDKFIRLEQTRIPVLDQFRKPTSGKMNWFSQSQLVYMDYLARDSEYLIRHYPEAYWESLKRAYAISFFPAPSDVTFGNRQHIARYENSYNFLFAHLNHINQHELYSDRLLHWHQFYNIKWDALSLNMYLLVMYFYITVFVFGVYKWLASVWRKTEGPAFRVTLFFMVFNIFYIIVGSNTFAWIGSNRYRFTVEPFFLTIFAVMLCRLYNALKRGRPSAPLA